MKQPRPVLAVGAFAVAVSMTWGCGGQLDRPIPLPEPLARGESVALPDDPGRQFDFWQGTWEVRNLRARSDETWHDVGPAVARVHGVAGGGAVLEQWDGTLDGKPLNGFSLRAWDPAAGRWSVWLNWHGGTPGGFSEMVGRRNGERMELFPPGDEAHLRYSFTELHEDSVQWERGRSKDGATWITDWVMQFGRQEPPLALDATNAPIVEPPPGAEQHPRTRELDFLIGAWEGPLEVHTPPGGGHSEIRVRARVTSMIEGFGLLQFLDIGPEEKWLTAMGWDREADGWVALAASGDGITRLAGEVEDRRVRLTSASAGLRHTWDCPAADRCAWQLESSSDGGATWVSIAKAELSRSTSTAAFIDIRNARTPFDQVLTGGQPSAEQFAWAARNGYRTIVNLRTPGENGELPDEAGLLEGLGLTYVVIPVAGADGLTDENAARLAEVLSDEDALPAMVHCASGNRVGALFGLKAYTVDGLTADEAMEIAHRAGITRLEPALRGRVEKTE